MNAITVQLLGSLALLGGVALSYWRWVRPRKHLSINARALLFLLILIMAGGFIGSIGWWTNDPRSFSWLLPPLASRMLAAAAWAFGAVALLTLQRPTRRRIRLTLLMSLVYFVPLDVAIALFHLNRFDFAAPITYAFFLLVVFITLSTLWFLWRQPTILTDEDRDRAALTPITRGWLTVVAIGMALWGVALFITDSGPSDLGLARRSADQPPDRRDAAGNRGWRDLWHEVC